MVKKTDIIGLEKAELHAHLNGCIPPAVLVEIAREKGVLPEDELARLLCPPQGWDNCFELFTFVYKLIRGHELFYRVTQEAIKDFVRQGVSYLELRTTLKSDPEMGVTWRSYMETVLRATEEMADVLPHVHWIISIDRSKGIEMAREAIDLAIDLKREGHAIVGIDFCGDPFKDHFQNYVQAFESARDEGLKTTFHFAEVPDAQDLHTMLDFRPDRIGHACNLPPNVLERVITEKVPVEICFSSNLATGVVGSPEEHSVAEFIKASHPITICTDDFGIFHSDINDEYFKIAQLLKLDSEQVKQLCAQSFEGNFLSR